MVFLVHTGVSLRGFLFEELKTPSPSTCWDPEPVEGLK